MYKKVWFKIHLYLGLTAGLVLFVIGLTGAILSFQTEILNLVNKKSLTVEVPNTPRLTVTQILASFQEDFPKSKINGITFSKAENSSVVINVAGGKGRAARRGINYYVNPYTAEVLPDFKGMAFFKFVENIHRRLAMGDVGTQIVGASTLMLFVLIFSGVYIYWKKIKKSFFKSLTFSFSSKGRPFLASLHSSLGMWVIPIYFVSSITGLYWSYSWFNQGLYSIAGVEKPVRMKRGGNQGKNAKVATQDQIQNVVDIFNQNVKEYENANFRFNGAKGVYTINYLDESSQHDRARNTIKINEKKASVVEDIKFADQPLMEKLLKSNYALHTGDYFGITGKIVMFIGALCMMLFFITGIMMYLKRR